MESFVNTRGIGYLSLCILSGIMCFLIGNPSLAAASVAKELPPDEVAWKAISPQLEIFWKDVEDSPFQAAKGAWPVIESLKGFIKEYPSSIHVPEAYYDLGEAYASISFVPEAIAHWRIVAKYYPDSKWAGEALTALVAYMKEQGQTNKLVAFYRELMRQFPDSKAAKTAKIILAIQALKEGKIKLATRVADQMAKASPSIEVEVPQFLDLEARLAEERGHYEEARRFWIHYINLIKLPSHRAQALFHIAETYRKEGSALKARKYYALIRRDYSNLPEALFARFRMAQMEEKAKKRLSRYVKGTFRQQDTTLEDQLFSKIVEQFPDYPLTHEVEFELTRLKLREKKFLDVLELAWNFKQQSPSNPYLARILECAREAEKALVSAEPGIHKLQEMVAFGSPFIQAHSNDPLASSIANLTQVLWLRLMNRLVGRHDPRKALDEYWRFRRIYKGLKDKGTLTKARPVAAKALLALDRDLLKQKRPMDLVNYHFIHRDAIEELDIPEHQLLLGHAWGEIGVPKAALRAYFRAFEMGTTQNLHAVRSLDAAPQGTKTRPRGRGYIFTANKKAELFIAWASQALKDGDLSAAENILNLLDSQCPDAAIGPRALALKARLAAKRGDWVASFNMAQDSLDRKARKGTRLLLFNASVKLGEWNQVHEQWTRIEKDLDPAQKALLLRSWGDEALNLEQPSEALSAYNRLSKLEPDNPAVVWRLALARTRAGKENETANPWQSLLKSTDPFWSKVAKAETQDQKFWNGIAGDFR